MFARPSTSIIQVDGDIGDARIPLLHNNAMTDIPDNATVGRTSMSTMVSHNREPFDNVTNDKPKASHLDASRPPGNPRINTGTGSVRQDDHMLKLKATRSRQQDNTDASLDNPLADYTGPEVVELGQQFAKEKNLLDLRYLAKNAGILARLKSSDDDSDHMDDKEGLSLWARAALVAQKPTEFEGIEGLTEDDRVALRRELTHSEFARPQLG